MRTKQLRIPLRAEEALKEMPAQRLTFPCCRVYTYYKQQLSNLYYVYIKYTD